MQSLKDLLSRITWGKYIPSTEQDELKKINGEIKDEIINGQIETIIKTKKITKKGYESIKQIIEKLVEDGLTKEEAQEIIEDVIKEIEDDNLEKMLDGECDRYTKYTETNPSEYISYKNERKLYLLRIDDNEISSKKLDKLIIKLKENLVHKKKENFRKFVDQKKIEYKGKKIIIYLTEDNKPYFDINHIINLFDEIKSKKDKYHEYNKSIVGYDIRDNEYGGFYIKEYIDQESFFKMLLHTNSIFSNKFKDDVAKILDNLTNKGEIQIRNDNLVVNIIPKQIDYFKEEYIYTQTYDNINLVEFVKKEIKKCKSINWNKYIDRHILYFFVITLEDPNGLNRILCKIGYSCDLVDRFKSLQSEYKCKFYLLGLKLINSIKDEKKFHTELKTKYPEFIINHKISGHDKDETYVFDIELYKTFLNYNDKCEFNREDIKLEEENEKMMKEYFENLDKRFETELELIQKLGKIVSISLVNNVYQKDAFLGIQQYHYKYMEQRDNNLHAERIKDKEIELKKMEYEHKEKILDREIELKRMDLEMMKIGK
jgi:hypothetical protein